jgi:hypothetical protein
MEKFDAALVTVIGIILALPLIKVPLPDPLANGLIALAVLIIGIAGLAKKASKK